MLMTQVKNDSVIHVPSKNILPNKIIAIEINMINGGDLT